MTEPFDDLKILLKNGGNESRLYNIFNSSILDKIFTAINVNIRQYLLSINLDQVFKWNDSQCLAQSHLIMKNVTHELVSLFSWVNSLLSKECVGDEFKTKKPVIWINFNLHIHVDGLTLVLNT